MAVQPPVRKLRWGRVLLLLLVLAGIGVAVYRFGLG
jgi:hypothetical protein